MSCCASIQFCDAQLAHVNVALEMGKVCVLKILFKKKKIKEFESLKNFVTHPNKGRKFHDPPK